MDRPPVVFLSHGAPDILLGSGPTLDWWRDLGRQWSAPRAILAISAHWQAPRPQLSLAGTPRTLHDFGGFAPALQGMAYPAPGAPDLARTARSLLLRQDIQADLHPDRGLDHGAWVPLSAMFPQARVPVLQMALGSGGPGEHLALGRALAPLRDDGVLILASGAITHNFAWLDWNAGPGAAPHPRALAFADWVSTALDDQAIDALLDYRNARHGAEAHPTEEHILPLFVALGAGGGRPLHVRPEFTHGALAMDGYLWA